MIGSEDSLAAGATIDFFARSPSKRSHFPGREIYVVIPKAKRKP
jgi:hypothetical protein